MSSLTGHLVADTYKALLKIIDNDVITATEKQISDGYGQGSNVFIDQNGFLRASKYKVTGASSSQFLKGDGSLDGTSYLPSGTSTTSIPEGTNKYFTELRVLNTILAGFTPVSGSVTATDSVLTAIEKIWWNIVNGGGGGGGGYVPYSGATQNLNLGEYGLNTGFVKYDTTPTTPPTTQGSTYWDVDHSSLAIIMNSAKCVIGQDSFFYVKNQTGATITKGTAVGFAGTLGASGRLLIAPFLADGSQPSKYFMGIVAEDIADGDEGFVLEFGQIRQLNTSAFVDGDILFVSPTIAGELTAVQPVAPNNIITAAAVVKSATNGVLQVRITLGSRLGEDEMVYLDNLTDKDTIIYNDSTQRFENKNIFHTQGYMPYYDDVDLLLDSPIFTDGTKIAIGTETFYGTNILTAQGGIWAEELTLNDNALIHTSPLSGNFFISRWSGTSWDVKLSFYENQITSSVDLEATKFIKTGGLATQFLMANGDSATISSLNLITGTSVTNYVTKFGGANQILQSQIFDNGTNVGVGTTSPNFKFEVRGGALGVYSSASYYGKQDISNNDYMFTSGSGFYFRTNDATATVFAGRINNSGNWGIGILNPTQKLDVNGNINIPTGSNYLINGVQLDTDDIPQGSTNQYLTEAGLYPYMYNFASGEIKWNVVTHQFYMNQSSAITSGWLSATDWNTFNNKENAITAGTTAQYWRGDKSWQTLNTTAVVEGSNLYFTNARAIGSTLTGYVSGAGTITASDTILSAIQKLNGNVSALVSGVSSVNGLTGAVTLTTSNISEGTNLYYTDARARASNSAGTGISYNATTGVISSTITQYTDAMARASLSFVAGSGAYNSTTGVITIPTNTNQLTNGAGFITGITSGMVTTALGYTPVPTTRTITINGTTQDLSADRSWTIAGTISGLTTNYVTKATSATTLGNSLIFDNGTNVGIGTTSINDKLEIGGSGNLGISISNTGNTGSDFSAIRFKQASTERAVIYTNNSNLNIRSGGSLILYTSSAEKVRIDTSGNLGLGVTPSAWGSSYKVLDISSYGSFGSTGSTTDVGNNIYNNGTSWIYKNTNLATLFRQSGGQHIWYNAPSGTAGTAISFTQAMTLNASGNLGVGTTTPTLARIQSTTDGTLPQLALQSTDASGVAWRFFESAGTLTIDPVSGLARKIKFTNSGAGSLTTIIEEGNVGIGTTSPSQLLHIYSTNGDLARIEGSSTGNNTNYYSAKNGSGDVMQLGIANAGYSNGSYPTIVARGSYLYSPRDLGIIAESGYPILFQTGGSERMRITSTGNVGIGSSTIQNVATNRTSVTINGTNTSILSFANGNVLKGWIYNDGTTIEIYSVNATIFTTGVAEKMRITTAGNVGIGTTSPTGELHIFGSQPAFRIQSSVSGNMQFGQWDTTNNRIQSSGRDFLLIGTDAYNTIFSTNSTERMRITSGGNVGIGTTTPQAKFASINSGNQNLVANAGLWVSHDASANGDGIGIGTNGSASYKWIQSYNGSLSLNPAGNNVGIGTTSPAYLLDVQGDVSVGKTSTANKLRIRRPSDGGATFAFLGFDSTSSNKTLILGNNSADGNVAFQCNSSEVFRIDEFKNVLIGLTSNTFGGGNGLRINQPNGLEYAVSIKSVDGLLVFYNSSFSVVGSISHNGTNTSYATSSDYRLKTDLRSFSGLQLLDKINVYDFAWKVDNSRMFGVMAHELQEVLPYAVTGIKDGNDMQGVDYSLVVPILVQSIKELKAEIASLKDNLK